MRVYEKESRIMNFLLVINLTGQGLGDLEKKTRPIPFGLKVRDFIRDSIRFQINIKNFKGMRHKQKYPARGQRTHTNAKTKRKMWY